MQVNVRERKEKEREGERVTLSLGPQGYLSPRLPLLPADSLSLSKTLDLFHTVGNTFLGERDQEEWEVVIVLALIVILRIILIEIVIVLHALSE